MTRIRSVDLLPEIFKTSTNKKFLSSTLDQLVQQPKLKQTEGYVGRRDNVVVNKGDYILEPSVKRANYQLEPGVIFKNTDGTIEDAITYPEIVDSLKVNGANVDKHDRLFTNNLYSWDPLIDFDKFINYSQYYWLPQGPDSVDVFSSAAALTDTFGVVVDAYNNTIDLSGVGSGNPTITLVRGGQYTFDTDNINPFYIQTQPGLNGSLTQSPNISNRDINGVKNNGGLSADIVFSVPEVDAQQFYYDLTDIGDVDLVTALAFDEVNYQYVRNLGSIDGITDLHNKTIIFTSTQEGLADDIGWEYEDQWDNDEWDDDDWQDSTPITDKADRYSIYQVELVYSDGEDPYVKLNRISYVNNLEKFSISYGETYSNRSFYKNAEGFFEEIPLLTAAYDTLYYQDPSNENMFGVINLVDAISAETLYISDIEDKETFTSANGVQFTNGLKVIFRGNVSPDSYQDGEYYVEGVGEAIKLISVKELITPEQYTISMESPFDAEPFDSVALDSAINAPLDLDYITINRSDLSQNAWARSNRWFHLDVIEKTAEYNNSPVVLDNDFRAKRSIIEFNANIRLYNNGTERKAPINVIDFTQTDAMSNVNNQSSYSVDGIGLNSGDRVIFANDPDMFVKNKIFVVNFIDQDADGSSVIQLVLAEDADVYQDNTVVCLFGNTQQGKTYYHNGVTWEESQLKTSINQSPMFDMYDTNGYSLGNSIIYSGSTFTGSKIFSYKQGNGVNDPILGFPLSYLNIDNLGDIVFENNIHTDTYTYGSNEYSIGSSKPKKYTSRTEYSYKVGWTNFASAKTTRQKFNFVYSGTSLKLDIIPTNEIGVPAVKVFVGGEFIRPDNYTVTVSASGTEIIFNTEPVNGTVIDVSIISGEASASGYYEVPKNLEGNAFNEESITLTLGTVRNHYNSLTQNIGGLEGVINGSNNSRDLGNIAAYGDIIVQHSSPLSVYAVFARKKEYNLFEALRFNSTHYELFKNKLLHWVASNEVHGLSASIVLNQALNSLNAGKNSDSAFYWSDMLPSTDDYTATSHAITAISTSVFNTINVYDFTVANNNGLLVYLNDNLLIKDTDYTVATDGPRVTIITELNDNDIVRIDEYTSTLGSYIPSTPTKLGLYPKFKPQQYKDDTYVVAQTVIQGHDGSITIAFGDIRDDVLLEFEKRIYNNIKVQSTIPLSASDVIPGGFRTTDYADEEIVDILSNDFLNWVGWNKVDYKTQNYLTTDEFTWNYSTSSSKLDNSLLKGHWRGTYRHYYDTDTPHLTPWEMIGLSELPSWWEDTYGPAPYTSGNLVLWKDLAEGWIRDPNGHHIDVRYVRDGLLDIIPVNSAGELVSPFALLVKEYSQPDFRKSWVVGDGAPTESAWKRSSSYPFAVQRLLALTKPAKYFALMVDRDRYNYDAGVDQYVYDNRHHLDIRTLEVLGQDTPKHSYVNWIVDYNRFYGYNDGSKLTTDLSNLDIRLCYRMASFTDKKYLKIFTEKSSPDSSNNTLMLPDESYELLLHKNQNSNKLQFSSVVVQKTPDGYAVYGNSTTEQYFQILSSIPNNNIKTFVVGNKTFRVAQDFTNEIVLVPYGFTFTNVTTVVDFIVSYGKLLESQGLQFNDTVNGIQLSWMQLANEFVVWSGQDWIDGSIINLNPNADVLEYEKSQTIVDSLTNSPITELPLDQDGNILLDEDYVIDRLDNNFKITSLNDKTVNFLTINDTSYEHLLVLDNVSIFNDLIYQPASGLRQQRIKINGFTTYDWNGQMDAQGFILNQDNVAEWESNLYYQKGDMVKFKNSYWGAVANIQPADTFNMDEWSDVDYRSIKTGLLPNVSTKAAQATDYYNNKTANLESDVDLLALGVTGFRPRSYLESFDDVSQVNVYSNVISQKGTANSTGLFRGVKIDKEESTYDVYENWAIRRATYGGSSNQAYIDIELNEVELQNNPSAIFIADETAYASTIITADDSATRADDTAYTSDNAARVHQYVSLTDIYKQNEIHTEDIFPLLTSKITDTNLPTAGHLRTDDSLIDDSVFELASININDVNEGYTAWVAKDTAFDWNVYSANSVGNLIDITSVERLDDDNFDYVLTFGSAHSLSINDKVAIKGIDDVINGLYIIDRIPSDETIIVVGEEADEVSIASPRVYKFNSVKDTFTEPTVDNVDTSLINAVSIYDKDTNITKHNLDYIDPLNGKILGAAQQNINFTGAIDPASYNYGNESTGILWGKSHTNEVWWDTSNCRFLDYNQNDIEYSSKTWGNLFPGSTIDVYQWVESLLHPSEYEGPGDVKDTENFTVVADVNSNNTIVNTYYYWVKGITDVRGDKSLSTYGITGYIESPKSSGIAYATIMRKNVVALYNANEYLSNGILHIEYQHSHDETNIFVEYDLIKENNENDFLSDDLYKKLQDSFCGATRKPDGTTLVVPDPNLSEVDKYGLSFRPRQSMFVNRLSALKVYLTQINDVLKSNVISESRTFGLLNKEDPMPFELSGEWDRQVDDLIELGYQDLTAVATGYKYLVTIDSDHDNLWTIYEVDANDELEFVKQQAYDTTKYWNYVDWYNATATEYIIPHQVVAVFNDLATLVATESMYVKVQTNNAGKWELYQYQSEEWVRVGLEDGTVAFSEVLWTQEIPCATRFIIRAINEELLVKDLTIHKNKMLISMFNYILAEQGNVEWLYKTSLIDVNHNIRSLLPYTTYKKDNQSFVLDYINEVKPYHTKIKEFLINYDGIELLNGNVGDFDVPSYYDTTFGKYISPVLDYDGVILTSDHSNFDEDGIGLKEVSNHNVWEDQPWDQWYNNRLLVVESITIVNAGSGYMTVPEVNIVGDAITPAEVSAKINSAGEITELAIDNMGYGYATTPTIEIIGIGTGATALPVMNNNLVRTIDTTVKYDRYQYTTDIVDWAASTWHNASQVFRYNDNVYRSVDAKTVDSAVITVDNSYDTLTVDANTFTVSVNSFDPVEYNKVDAGTLSGIDRISGLYVADVNSPGLDLALLIDGIDYPGIKVKGLDYNSTRELDTIFESAFTDVYLGTKSTDINVEGGEFIDEYSSHAPEELVPGSIFDTLDLTVDTRPGFDYSGNGHAFDLTTKIFEYKTTSNTFSFDDLVYHPTAIKVINSTTGNVLNETRNYTIDWVNKVVTVTSGVNDNENIKVIIYEIGGGNQLYRNSYIGGGGNPTQDATAIANFESGSVTSITMLGNGLGYEEANPPIVTIGTPVANKQSMATIATDGDEITNVYIAEAGYGYENAPIVTITSAPASNGSPATATSSLTNDSVTSVTIIDGGSAYATPPNVIFENPPSVTTATAELSVTMLLGAISSVSIDNSGSHYASAPSVTIDAPAVSVNATGTVTIADNIIDTAVVDVAGNYYSVTPTVTVGVPTGVASTSIGTAQVSNGLLADINVDDGGNLYDTAPTVTITPVVTAGVQATATSSLSATIDGFDGNNFDMVQFDGGEGGVGTISLVETGSGYTVAPIITISAPDLLNGTQATATATINTGSGEPYYPDDGYVVSISVTNAGSGYTSAPVITLSAPTANIINGADATAIANMLNGQVDSIGITNTGHDYDIAPTITVSAPPQATQAVIQANVTGGQVDSLTITNAGWGYIAMPIITIAPGDVTPVQATISTSITGDAVTGTSITNAGAGYLTTPNIVVDAPSAVANDVAQGTAVLTGGVVTGITIVNGGSNYTSAPTITLDAPAGLLYHGSGASATTTVNAQGEVNSISIVSTGSGYDLPPTIALSAPSRTVRQATGIANVIGNAVDSIIVTDAGTGYLDAPSVVIELPASYRIVVPVEYSEIANIVILVNGNELTSGYTYDRNSDLTYTTVVNFDNEYQQTDNISITVFGNDQHSHSYPETQSFTTNGVTLDFDLTIDTSHKNRQNAIVEHNGLRLRPPEMKRYISDGYTTDYELPTESGVSHALISSNEVIVYVNEELKTLSTDYTVSGWDGSNNRYIIFGIVPDNNDIIDIYVTTKAQYVIDNAILTIREIDGVNLAYDDVIAITCWKDANQMDIMTKVFIGPTGANVTNIELFDSDLFDSRYFDEITSTGVDQNIFPLQRTITDKSRAWVTKNGRMLNSVDEYYIDGENIVLTGVIIEPNDHIYVTSITDSIVPNTLSFKIFSDMRGNTAMYKISRSNTANLIKQLEITDDIIYLDDVNALGEPNIDVSIFGIVNINGERITYRERDLENNTISGLMRGSAGTAINTHIYDSDVVDVSSGSVVATPYNKIWYQQGENSASNGISLQKQETVTAKFIKR